MLLDLLALFRARRRFYLAPLFILTALVGLVLIHRKPTKTEKEQDE